MGKSARKARKDRQDAESNRVVKSRIEKKQRAAHAAEQPTAREAARAAQSAINKQAAEVAAHADAGVTRVAAADSTRTPEAAAAATELKVGITEKQQVTLREIEDMITRDPEHPGVIVADIKTGKFFVEQPAAGMKFRSPDGRIYIITGLPDDKNPNFEITTIDSSGAMQEDTKLISAQELTEHTGSIKNPGDWEVQPSKKERLEAIAHATGQKTTIPAPQKTAVVQKNPSMEPEPAQPPTNPEPAPKNIINTAGDVGGPSKIEPGPQQHPEVPEFLHSLKPGMYIVSRESGYIRRIVGYDKTTRMLNVEVVKKGSGPNNFSKGYPMNLLQEGSAKKEVQIFDIGAKDAVVDASPAWLNDKNKIPLTPGTVLEKTADGKTIRRIVAIGHKGNVLFPKNETLADEPTTPKQPSQETANERAMKRLAELGVIPGAIIQMPGGYFEEIIAVDRGTVSFIPGNASDPRGPKNKAEEPIENFLRLLEEGLNNSAKILPPGSTPKSPEPAPAPAKDSTSPEPAPDSSAPTSGQPTPRKGFSKEELERIKSIKPQGTTPPPLPIKSIEQNFVDVVAMKKSAKQLETIGCVPGTIIETVDRWSGESVVEKIVRVDEKTGKILVRGMSGGNTDHEFSIDLERYLITLQRPGTKTTVPTEAAPVAPPQALPIPMSSEPTHAAPPSGPTAPTLGPVEPTPAAPPQAPSMPTAGPEPAPTGAPATPLQAPPVPPNPEPLPPAAQPEPVPNENAPLRPTAGPEQTPTTAPTPNSAAPGTGERLPTGPEPATPEADLDDADLSTGGAPPGGPERSRKLTSSEIVDTLQDLGVSVGTRLTNRDGSQQFTVDHFDIGQELVEYTSNAPDGPVPYSEELAVFLEAVRRGDYVVLSLTRPPESTEEKTFHGFVQELYENDIVEGTVLETPDGTIRLKILSFEETTGNVIYRYIKFSELTDAQLNDPDKSTFFTPIKPFTNSILKEFRVFDDRDTPTATIIPPAETASEPAAEATPENKSGILKNTILYRLKHWWGGGDKLDKRLAAYDEKIALCEADIHLLNELAANNPITYATDVQEEVARIKGWIDEHESGRAAVVHNIERREALLEPHRARIHEITDSAVRPIERRITEAHATIDALTAKNTELRAEWENLRSDWDKIIKKFRAVNQELAAYSGHHKPPADLQLRVRTIGAQLDTIDTELTERTRALTENNAAIAGLHRTLAPWEAKLAKLAAAKAKVAKAMPRPTTPEEASPAAPEGLAVAPEAIAAAFSERYKSKADVDPAEFKKFVEKDYATKHPGEAIPPMFSPILLLDLLTVFAIKMLGPAGVKDHKKRSLIAKSVRLLFGLKNEEGH